MAERTTLRIIDGHWSWIIPLLLLIALIANILGLVLPFLEIDEAFHDKVIYSLPHSVELMWQRKLHFVSLLILVFSIIFPFVKLFSLIAVWFLPWKAKNRERYLHVIELLGKWSYLDIFVVILLLSLTSDQANIASTVHPGVYFFIGAITLSMVTSEIIMTLTRKQCEAELPERIYSAKRKWMLIDNIYLSWIVPVLVFASAIALIESLHATFLRISQMFLVSHSYSINQIGIVLQEEKHWVLLIVLVCTLLVVPMLRLALLLGAWTIPLREQTHVKVKQILDVLSRWCMLDVFGLALFLITTEGKDLVKTEIQPGLYVVVSAIGLSYILGVMAIMLNKAMIAKANRATQAS
ncbi:MAG: hypothetical protein CMJ26_02730 [Phycisphaerae bacterium]|nr:hypothetical protein [Phycisphaerae bacterium]|tara:strand:- start:2315 stop:3370 length:1056 start_codon:yes stop_codon:yes gene_type:complete